MCIHPHRVWQYDGLHCVTVEMCLPVDIWLYHLFCIILPRELSLLVSTVTPPRHTGELALQQSTWQHDSFTTCPLPVHSVNVRTARRMEEECEIVSTKQKEASQQTKDEEEKLLPKNVILLLCGNSLDLENPE